MHYLSNDPSTYSRTLRKLRANVDTYYDTSEELGQRATALIGKLKERQMAHPAEQARSGRVEAQQSDAFARRTA